MVQQPGDPIDTVCVDAIDAAAEPAGSPRLPMPARRTPPGSASTGAVRWPR